MKELGDSVELVWDSIQSYDRSLMISMFLSRPALRNLVVHLKPTIAQAKRIIDSDPHFDQDEKYWATKYLPTLVDKCWEKQLTPSSWPKDFDVYPLYLYDFSSI